MSDPTESLKAAATLFTLAADEEEESKLTDSIKAASAVTTLGADQAQETANPVGAVQAAAAVVALGSESTSNLESWTKNAIIKLKNNSDTDKSELQRLNLQLETYLENVRVLEQLNKTLIGEVDKAKEAFAPKLFDRSEFDPQLNKLRVKLEEESNECVKFKARIEESENLIQHIGQRIKFYQSDVQADRQKIAGLENQLADINSQRDYLVRSSNLAEESITREKQRIAQAENDLENLIKKLKQDRSKNKQIEFEMQTLNDELAFLKAVFQEELNDMRLKVNASGLTSSDLTNFYKNELVTAIRQIRQDFNTMSDQQLADYKDHKENELKLAIQQNEKERLKEQELRSKNEANKDLELQSVNELRTTLDGNKKDMNKLNTDFSQLSMRLAQLEDALRLSKNKNQDLIERKLAEIEKLKEQNGTMENEVEYWDRVTRSKLETEIQTYRSILNSQIRMMQSFDENIKFVPVKPPPKKPSIASVVVNTVTDVKPQPSKVEIITPEPPKPQPPSGPIEILRQVFDYFDTDRSGRINSSELEKVLEKLNVKLSKEAYEQVLSEGDKDMSRDIDFAEFCKIMLPVLNGKFEEDELFYAFKKFDLDGSGYISSKELRQILSKIGQIYSESQILELISTVAANPSRGLTFPEFSQLMRQPTPRPEVQPVVVVETPKKDIISSVIIEPTEIKIQTKPVTITIKPGQHDKAEAIEILRRVFDAFDIDKTGRINSSELDKVLERLNVKLSKDALEQILKEGDKDLSRDIDFAEFCKIMLPALTGKFEDDELLYAFRKFDLDGSGFITAKELRHILSKIDFFYTESQIQSMIASVDTDKDGRLNFPEFVKLMKHPNPSELVSKPSAADVIISSVIQSDSYVTTPVAIATSVVVPTTRPAVQERNKSIELLKEIFDNFDADKTGRINSSELERVLERLNVKLSKEAYDEILKEGDKDMSRDIDFGEFCKIMLPVFTGKFEDDELLYAFKKFDLDGSGYITASELRQILSKIGQFYSESEIEKMIAAVDLDKDGKLNFPEFAKLMKQPASSN